MKLIVELQNYDARLLDEYEGEKTDKEIERDIKGFNDFIQEIADADYDIEKIDNYIYKLNNLTEAQFYLMIATLTVLQELFNICCLVASIPINEKR